MMVRRSLFSVLESVFVFCRSAGAARFRVWPSVKRELGVLIRLAPLVCARLDEDVFSMALAVDASSTGCGVVALPGARDSLAAVSSSVAARTDVSSVSVKSERFLRLFDESHLSDLCRTDVDDLSLPSPLFVSDEVKRLVSAPATTLASFPWREEAHINELEMRAVLCGLRKLLSCPSTFGAKVVLLTDSAVVFHALRKGRCSSHALLCRLRPVGCIDALVPGVGPFCNEPCRWTVARVGIVGEETQ